MVNTLSEILTKVGKTLYKTEILKEYKRYVVFRFRCMTHKEYINDILSFFAATPLRKQMLEGCPAFVEQTTRSFFYKDSTWQERISLVKTHIELLEKQFKPELLQELYVEGKRICLWQDEYQEKPLKMELWFHSGQRKEGCLSLVLNYEGEELYQIMFWLGMDSKEQKPTIYVGAIQGIQNGSEIIKGLTKAFFGYRTKNLIFYGLRNIAKVLGADKIYAVCNEGYYAMNHIRVDRKLKTDFGAFWEECEGVKAEDKRFYVMPVEEYRKSMEELKPSKRAQHRRRFAKMDEVTEAIAKVLGRYKR